MIFKSLATTGQPEALERKRNKGFTRLRFGVEFLDDALRGIFPDDLVLLGAPSGVGKTQLCCNIATANLSEGKRVHYIALEASEYEIERRLKYPLVAERYFADPNRPRLSKNLNYPDWVMGEFTDELELYEKSAQEFFEVAYRDMFLLYKSDKFGIHELIQAVLSCSHHTDLIMIDHAHYFDFDDDNENRAMKSLAKEVRRLAIDEKIPIVLVAHLRKSDRKDESLVPGMEEFHGSSDLFKIATKIITFSPGKATQNGTYETYFRCPKNRADGGVTRYSAREFFNPKKGGYEPGKYQIGWAEQKRSRGFEGLDVSMWPDWARRHRPSPAPGWSAYGSS